MPAVVQRACVLALLALISLAGPTLGDDEGKPAAVQLAVMQQRFGDFDAILKRHSLRVLVASSKMIYFADRGRQRGLAYDAFKFFEDESNKKLGKKDVRFHVVFVPVPRDQLVSRLRDGYGDVAAANLTITPERAKRVDFSDPLVSGIDEVVITGPDAPQITKVEDLAGKEVFARKSSSYYESLIELNGRFAKQGLRPVVLKTAPEELEDEDLLEMTNAGLVKIIVVDSHIARFWAQIFDDIRVHDDVKVRSGGEIAWMVRKGSPKLKAALDDFIEKHGVGNSFGNQIFRRYLKDTKYVKNAAGEAEMKKFREVVEYFRKYGDEYHIDPLLMAAQGYQESQLDQTKRNPSGAVGVMQVLPSTGKELAVGDIRMAEPNVHAGVKYIRFMVDRYYADEPMDDLNRALFAFASYNAGPARVRKLRAEAKERGLDPNVWFANVELVAAERIGRETVQYVSNIYKYYIAYKLLDDARIAREAAKREVGAK